MSETNLRDAIMLAAEAVFAIGFFGFAFWLERKWAEEELRKAEERDRKLVELRQRIGWGGSEERSRGPR